MVKLLKSIKKFLNQRPQKRTNLKILLSNIGKSPKVQLNKKDDKYTPEVKRNHLHAAMDWLCAAQDATPDGGVSACYRLHNGWAASYPETTGYIITTFFDYFHFTNGDEYKERAIKMADWLTFIQLKEGAFQGYTVEDEKNPIVFNTGQIMIGLVRAYQETKDPKYLNSATKAGQWLISVQDDDGAWRKCSYGDIPHVYHTRVAWPLLELFKMTGDHFYKDAAVKNLEWALSKQDENGWYHENYFFKHMNPFTHNIVYAARGLFESGRILNESICMESAQKVADVLKEKFYQHGFLAGEFTKDWTSDHKYTCLTGNAQLSILLSKLSALKKNEDYLKTVRLLNNHLCSTQNIKSKDTAIFGAIAGSVPIWGNYMDYAFPNWAAKFFADALLLELKAEGSLVASS